MVLLVVLIALLVYLGAAGGTTPSGPPPGGQILPEGVPVAPRGLMRPRFTPASGRRVITPATGQHYWSDPSPPVRDLNGTYHIFAARRSAAGAVGAVIVHFQCSSPDLAAPSATWSGGEVVLSPNASGWDDGGVFSPGAALDAVNGTWSLYYSGVARGPRGNAGSKAGGYTNAWVGLASSPSPIGPFTRAYGGAAVVLGGGSAPSHGGAGVQYAYANGAIPAGGDLGSHNSTVAAAELHCNLDPMCKGFTFQVAVGETVILLTPPLHPY